jgi:Tol biopolymer transport system component
MRDVVAIRTQGRFAVGGWVAVAVAALTLALGVGAAEAAFPGTNGRIAFAVDKWAPADPCLPVPHGCEPDLVSSTIETVRASGRGRRVLYKFPAGPATDSGLTWSPSGRLLAFEWLGRLAIIRRDGTGLRRLPQLTERDSEPAWSPDGRRLAFVGSRRCDYCYWIHTVRLDGTALRPVIAQGAASPAWSVTGRIAFVHYYDQYAKPASVQNGLYTIKPDGSRLRRLFGRYWGPGQAPDWSPDASRIAFVARGQIFTLGADGRGLRRLTAFKQDLVVSGLVWSPDGKYIAFARTDDLYVMRANGRGLRRVIDTQSPQPNQAWSEVGAPSWQALPR